MSGCPHEYHEREASVYVDGLCPLCQRAEIERLQERLKGSDMLAHVRGEQIERLQAELALYKQNYARKQLTDDARRALEGK